MASTTLLCPLKLDAFAFSKKTCESDNYCIAPITQPNYTFLRLHDNLIIPDILDHVDLHSVKPANLNPRATDLGTGETRQSRLGVYIHWTLPQLYRFGSAAAPPTPGTNDVNQTDRKLQQGFPSSSAAKPAYGASPDYTAPDFRPIPNRWMIIRRLQQASIEPKNANIPTFQSWVVESDRLSNINDTPERTSQVNDPSNKRSKLDDPGFPDDIEAERTPFINPHDLDPKGGRVIEGQAENFIGRKTLAQFWDPNEADTAPRVDLNVLASSNPLFADYQYHNSNVLSIVDNFKYLDSTNNIQYLQKATCDYFVLGWHSESDHDPMTTSSSVKPQVHADRLDACQMELKESTAQSVKNWLTSSTPTRILCHASMYDVQYDSDHVPKRVPADVIGNNMMKNQSISVGVTPLDALLAYCRAHVSLDGPDLKILEQDLLRLQTLLSTADSDDVDGIQAATDETFKEAFNRYDGGTLFHYHREDDPKATPGPEEIQTLQALNQVQNLYRSMSRETSSARWQLFAKWWSYVSGFGQNMNNDQYKGQVHDLVRRLSELGKRQLELTNSINSRKTALSDPLIKKAPQQGTQARFYQRKEPTVLFGNIKSGWEDDFSDKLKVRLQEQAITINIVNDAAWSGLQTFLSGPTSIDGNSMPKGVLGLLPVELQSGALALCMEFYQLRTATDKAVTSATLPQVIPWFHNEDARKETRGRDLWQSTQPWKPLFIEWEALYFHIPWEKWKFKQSPTFSGTNVVHYGFDEEIAKASISDMRSTSGRVLLLPQAQSSIGTTLAQIFANTNEKDLDHLFSPPAPGFSSPKEEQKNLLAKIGSLDFVSAPLSGLTSDLLTLHDGGMHVKPTVRLPNSTPVPIESAAAASKPINITSDIMQLMESDTTSVPYGNSVGFDSNGPPPMKLVTHGQIMFTKINIVDKFGQAIAIIDQRPHRRVTSLGTLSPVATITPCLSDTYFPGTIDGKAPSLPTSRANTVLAQSNNAACPFIQLPPAINQPARLNAAFVQQNGNSWRVSNEWENPIWGWLVVNYAEQGLQIFFPDGTFYREVRLGGPKGTATSLKWLPFDPPSTNSNTTQLDNLLKRLSDKDYLQGFFDMINDSIASNQVAAPGSYATFSSAIIGKPVAMVNVGWSLELADTENLNWSTVNTKGPDRHLLLTNGSPVYEFPVKIGDYDRSYDGLIGYFPTKADCSIDLSTLYTYYTPDKKPSPTDPRILISTQGDQFPRFMPFYDLVGKAGGPVLDPTVHMQVFGTIMDPFLPVHAYSAILPNVALKLPDWTVQDALKKITAFWHIGPLIVPTDVPKTFNEARALMEDPLAVLKDASAATDKPVASTATLATTTPASATASPAPATTTPTPATGGDASGTTVKRVEPKDPVQMLPKVSIPLAAPAASSSGANAMYRYLQPYLVEDPQDSDGDGSKLVTRFNVFGISDDAASGADAGHARLMPGPYTAVEGFAQIVRIGS